jgi:alpha-L-rhamnosidase
MFGEINAWMYKALGGIKPDPNEPGFKNVLLSPNFVKGLDSFYAEHEGPYGKIISSWQKEGNKVIYNIVIPPNSTATIWLSGKFVTMNGEKLKSYGMDGNKFKVQTNSGKYEFTIEN